MDQNEQQHEGLDRRGFMKTSAAAAVSAAVATSAGTSWAQKKPGDDGLIHRNERPDKMTYRKLGNTNFMCSRLVFGCGAALAGGKSVRLLETSFEAGVNFYDVGSNVYYKGSEKTLSPFLKAHKGDVWVASKAPLRPLPDHEVGTPLTVEQGKFLADYWTRLLEESLKDLDVDYVDAYYLMAVGDPAVAKSEELYQAFLKAKEAGKVGHWGISTHKRAEQVLEAMIETGWYDLVQIAVTPAGWYDWDSRSLLEGTPPMAELQPTLDRAREAGIGLIGMKAGRYIAPKMSGGNATENAFDEYYPQTLMEADLTPFQRSYAYVLEHGLDAVNADMQNYNHFEQNLAATAKAHEYFA